MELAIRIQVEELPGSLFLAISDELPSFVERRRPETDLDRYERDHCSLSRLRCSSASH